ncbi:MAG: type II toxin-antitoxin system RelE/ParE family toxin [Candidatus Hydrogenedentes bacterium]|nr:type II toxin-antitoxin system RelE/ParE family toxin [Candidatus Hydrogenedentota bacterium]
MAEIRWTEESVVWLRDIHDYISRDNPIAANEVVSGIFDRAQGLVQFPQLRHKYRDEPDGEIRVLLFGHYRIAYLLKSADDIDILGVFHGALDIDEYLP